MTKHQAKKAQVKQSITKRHQVKTEAAITKHGGLITQAELDAETNGAKAIMFLQGIAGITETEEKARAGWRKLNAEERAQTMLAYDTFKPETVTPVSEKHVSMIGFDGPAERVNRAAMAQAQAESVPREYLDEPER